MLAAMFKKPNIQIQTTELPQSIQNPPEGPAIPPPPPFIPRAPVTKEGIMNLL